MKNKKNKLSYEDMRCLSELLFSTGLAFTQEDAMQIPKLIAALAFELQAKIDKLLVGVVKPSYRLKLKPSELQLLILIKKLNPHFSADQDNAVVRLLTQNNG